MELYQQIVAARKQKGLTQEQLADLSNVTVRTIQRIENREGIPRAYTLKTISSVLGLNFEELVAKNGTNEPLINSEVKPVFLNHEDSKHFLKFLCLSCFSYLVVPYIHFLIPTYLLKKTSETNPAIIAFAKKIIQTQLYWMAAFLLLLFATLAYNIIMTVYFQKAYLVNYLVPFFTMYFTNAIIILVTLIRIKRIDTIVKLPR